MEDLETKNLLEKITKIKEAIRQNNGNKSKAAAMLGITRNQMYRLLNKAKNEKLI